VRERHLCEQLISDITLYCIVLYIAAQRHYVKIIYDGLVLTGRKKCIIWKIRSTLYGIKCNIARDMDDYRFPTCHLFRRQITHGFEETHQVPA